LHWAVGAVNLWRPAKVLGIPKDKVKLNHTLMGGGFGRRGNRDVDFILDAVLMSKEAGRPVKVMWTREDDIANGRFRPISAHALKAGFDTSGKLTTWQHRSRPRRSLHGSGPLPGGGLQGFHCHARRRSARRSFLRNHAPDIAAMDLFIAPTHWLRPALCSCHR
jgi:hypothetical protein